MTHNTTDETYRRVFQFAKKYLISHLPEGISEKDLDKYFIGDACEAKDLRDIFIVFVKSAQQYQRMPNVIQFDNRKEEIGRILKDFDYKLVVDMKEDELCASFRTAFTVKSKDGNRNSWHKWSTAVVDSARFLNGFHDKSDFDEFVKRFDYNVDTRMALPLLISTKIRGIGFALACNALKELG